MRWKVRIRKVSWQGQPYSCINVLICNYHFFFICFLDMLTFMFIGWICKMQDGTRKGHHIFTITKAPAKRSSIVGCAVKRTKLLGNLWRKAMLDVQLNVPTLLANTCWPRSYTSTDISDHSKQCTPHCWKAGDMNVPTLLQPTKCLVQCLINNKTLPHIHLSQTFGNITQCSNSTSQQCSNI